MQVSKLEIKGFKSFGDKVTLNFNDGITGIVGPNGCGKSNIVDAIRWVLGEQKTRNLRSDKMENVIFNGSKNRKPVQMAEVSLTFDNDKGILPSEYSQVTVTRRYHRSGDSEEFSARAIDARRRHGGPDACRTQPSRERRDHSAQAESAARLCRGRG